MHKPVADILNDDVIACARLLERGDPERFRAVMATPLEVRKTLFPIFAFNLEVARAPWVTKEPLIAEMRLQWWQDVLGEISDGRAVRRHEVATPLAISLTPAAAEVLKAVVEARRHDIYPDPFATNADFQAYILATSGCLMRVAAQALGPADDQVLADFGYAAGVANYLKALPELTEAGKTHIPDTSEDAVQLLAHEALLKLRSARKARGKISKKAGYALLTGWQSGAVLAAYARRSPAIAYGGDRRGVRLSGVRLLGRSLLQRW